jgi:DNA-binding NtrC family response regulator
MPKILIVDDEATIASLLQRAFSRQGYEVCTAADAHQAMELCKTQTFDVMLSDVVMPSLNGHELARWVARNYPAMRTILMSGYDQGCHKCAYSPRCQFVAKPFSPTDVVACVGRLLAGSREPDLTGIADDTSGPNPFCS